MLVKFTQVYEELPTFINPARVDYIEQANELDRTFIYFAGVSDSGANRIKVYGTLDEVAAKLNGEAE